MARLYDNFTGLTGAMVAESAEFRAAAEDILEIVQSIASEHIRTGEYYRNIRIVGVPNPKQGSFDDLLVTAEGTDAEPPMLIEYGGLGEDGKKRVKGLLIMARAYQRIPSG